MFEHVIYQLERKYQSSTNQTQSTGETKVIHLSENKTADQLHQYLGIELWLVLGYSSRSVSGNI